MLLTKAFIISCLILTSVALAKPIVWDASPTTLSSSSASVCLDPCVCMDSNGNSCAAWVEDQMAVTSFKSFSGTWTTPQKLSSTAGSQPKIIVDPNGNLNAIWIENGSLRTSSASMSGESPNWSSAYTLTASGTSNAELGVDQQGNLTVIWTSNDAISCTTKPFNGAWPKDPVILSEKGADFSKISFSKDGTAVVVWHQQVNSISTIYASHYSGSWSVPIAITDGTINCSYPVIGLNSKGNAIAGWYRFDLANNTYSNVFFQVSNYTTGQAWSPPIDLSSPGITTPHDLVSKIIFSDSDDAIAGWTVSTDGISFQIESLVKLANQNWSQNTAIIVNSYSFDFDFSISNSNTAVGLISILTENLDLISLQSCICDSNPNMWINPQSVCLPQQNSGQPRIATSYVNNNQSTVAVWQSYDGVNTMIQARSGNNWVLRPPTNLTVKQISVNRGIYIEYYNIVSWTASPSSRTSRYLIYRNGISVGQVDASTLQFIDMNRDLNQAETYTVFAYEESGEQSFPISVNFP
jgi:hypothetical protein